eukprot:m.33882 g.33882  ORF g.33882 m.33882 type:complete len:312 (+) comp12960_c0_seq4:618-1553(+)
MLLCFGSQRSQSKLGGQVAGPKIVLFLILGIQLHPVHHVQVFKVVPRHAIRTIDDGLRKQLQDSKRAQRVPHQWGVFLGRQQQARSRATALLSKLLQREEDAGQPLSHPVIVVGEADVDDVDHGLGDVSGFEALDHKVTRNISILAQDGKHVAIVINYSSQRLHVNILSVHGNGLLVAKAQRNGQVVVGIGLHFLRPCAVGNSSHDQHNFQDSHFDSLFMFSTWRVIPKWCPSRPSSLNRSHGAIRVPRLNHSIGRSMRRTTLRLYFKASGISPFRDSRLAKFESTIWSLGAPCSARRMYCSARSNSRDSR